LPQGLQNLEAAVVGKVNVEQNQIGVRERDFPNTLCRRIGAEYLVVFRFQACAQKFLNCFFVVDDENF